VYPEDQALTETLTRVICGPSSDDTGVAILDRRKLPGSTFPVEVISCRMPGGTTIQLFCKYEAGRHHSGQGHRGGVSYEADVYEQILEPIQASAPAFFGRHRDDETGDTWLFIEALDGQSIANTHRPHSFSALRQASAWIGGLHSEGIARMRRCPSLIRYDATYYQGFVDRVMEFSVDSRQRYPWLATVCRRADEFIDQLLRAEQTFIHGEFYPGNVIYAGDRICPVDWESAAIGPGELDVAALTEGWAPQLVAECVKAYADARWPDGAPPDFRRTVAAARLYWPFRWLGDHRDKFRGHRKAAGWLEQLLEQARQWPLIDR
jgi:hypothetical protein